MRSRLLQRGTLIAGLVLLAGCLTTGGDDATGNNAGGTTGEPSVPGSSSGASSSGGSSSGTPTEGGTVDPPNDAGAPTDANVTDASVADAEADAASDAGGEPTDAGPADAGGDPDAGGPPEPPFLIYTCSRKKAAYADYDAYLAGDTYWAIDSNGNKFTGVRPAGAPTKTKIGAESPMFYNGPAVGTASPPAGATPAGQLTAAELATLRAAIATLTAGPAEAYPTQTGGGSGYLLASSWTSDAAGKSRRMDYDQYRFGLHVSAEMWFHKSTYAAAAIVRRYNCATEFGTLGVW